jgi:hypothetical protein
LREYPATAPQRNSDINRGKDELDIGSSYAMRWHTSSASSSSAGIADDIFRLIPSNMRPAFREMLEIEFRGRELIAHEKRRAAERIWHKFLKLGGQPLADAGVHKPAAPAVSRGLKRIGADRNGDDRSWPGRAYSQTRIGKPIIRRME